MPATCRADVEALLRARKLDRTLVPVTATSGSMVVPETVPTGLAVLDQQLGGGIPLGHFSEITGPRSSGRTSLLMSLLASATARGDLVALVDTFDTFDAASAAASGVRLDHLLWVRGDTCTPAFPLLATRQTGIDRSLERAVKAMNLVLQAGGFSVVVLDLADAPTQALRRVPTTTWMRLQRVLEGQTTAGVVLASAPLSRSAGGVSITLHQRSDRTTDASSGLPRGSWWRPDGQTTFFHGLESEVQFQRARLLPGITNTPVRLRASAVA
ncbi:MAG: hypothetical protein NTY02_15035 [Acidobacteria bacterium]|nr:hypothetical protein [Acidobacteriota bacterium]